MGKELSDIEIEDLRKAYQNDPTLQKINKAMMEIREQALYSGAVLQDGTFELYYSEETEKAILFWQRHMEYHIRVNYPGLL